MRKLSYKTLILLGATFWIISNSFSAAHLHREEDTKEVRFTFKIFAPDLGHYGAEYQIQLPPISPAQPLAVKELWPLIQEQTGLNLTGYRVYTGSTYPLTALDEISQAFRRTWRSTTLEVHLPDDDGISTFDLEQDWGDNNGDDGGDWGDPDAMGDWH